MLSAKFGSPGEELLVGWDRPLTHDEASLLLTKLLPTLTLEDARGILQAK